MSDNQVLVSAQSTRCNTRTGHRLLANNAAVAVSRQQVENTYTSTYTYVYHDYAACVFVRARTGCNPVGVTPTRALRVLPVVLAKPKSNAAKTNCC
jgi:hypothetical protein